jgi:polyhydroxyalkanoate synthesis regulator phasin
MALGKIGKLFFDEVEDSNEAQVQQPQKQEQQQPTVANSVNTNTTAQVAATPNVSSVDPNNYQGKTTETYVNLLCDSIRENDCQGPDYLELHETVFTSDLKNIPDVNSRWKTAFSMIKVLNKDLTKQYVLDSIDIYCKVIERELATALKQFDQKYQDEIVAKEKKVENMKSHISDSEQQIENLKKQIAQIENKISGDRQAIATTEQEISATKVDIFVKQQDLKASAEHIKNQMLTDKKMLMDVLPND